jgi:predicted MFS family arabinose efflux permease
VIGDSLPRERRAVAFSVQSILVRLPRVIAAPLGGLLIAGAGMAGGIRIALGVTIVLAGIVLLAQYFGFRDDRVRDPEPPSALSRPTLHRGLLNLLAADCLVRIGEGIAASFIVLTVIEVKHLTATEYGVLYAIQQSVSIASYLPGGRIADLMGRRPIVGLTFLFFACFPLGRQVRGRLWHAGGRVRDWRPQGDWRTRPQIAHRRSGPR